MARVSGICSLVFCGALLGTGIHEQPASAGLLDKAKKLTKGAEKGVNKGVDGAKGAVDDAAKGAEDKYKDLENAAKKNLDKVMKDAQGGYSQSLAYVNKTLTAMERAAYEKAAKAFYTENNEYIHYVNEVLTNLINNDKEFEERLARVVRRSVDNKIDDQFRKDMEWLTERVVGSIAEEKAELILPTSKESRLDGQLATTTRLPSGGPVIPAKSGKAPERPKWLRAVSLNLGIGGGLGYGGGEGAIGGVGDVYKRKGKDWDCRGFYSVGGLVGWAKGIQGGVFVGFWPTSTVDAAGGNFGVHAGYAQGKAGGALEVVWNFTDKNSVNPSPGFVLGYAPGTGGEGGFMGGYEWTFR